MSRQMPTTLGDGLPVLVTFSPTWRGEIVIYAVEVILTDRTHDIAQNLDAGTLYSLESECAQYLLQLPLERTTKPRLNGAGA